MSVRFLTSSLILLCGLWLGWIILVDFFVVKIIFSEIDDFFKAGHLGMTLFSKLNLLEFLCGSFILSLVSMIQVKTKKSKFLVLIGFLLFILSFFNLFYLTPKIIYLTQLWQRADVMGLVGLAGVSDLQQEHQFFHRIYISLDAVKLFLLLTLSSIAVWKNSRES